MFKVGDTVVHSGYGICTVGAILDNIPPDTKGPVYIIELKQHIPGHFRLLIPEDKIKKSGVRYPIKRDKIPHVFQILEDSPNDLSKDCKEGYPVTKKRFIIVISIK